MSEPTNDLIVIKQLPIIEESLRSMSEDIDKAVAEAKSLVCNEETVKSVKAIRADLTKQLDALEEKRKAVKSSVMEPYEAFEKVYKEYVSEKFKTAIADLKKKIDDTEDGIKAEKAEEVRAYFAEYAASKNIDYVTFERADIQVSLSATTKKLKEQAKAFLDKVSDELALIDTQENKAEILVEYKASLNVATAIRTVSARFKAVEDERKRQEDLQAFKAKEQPRIAEVETLSAPVVVAAPVEEKRYTAKFTVSGTIGELQDLKEFLDNGGYKYESE